jgi:hypothetical protein
MFKISFRREKPAVSRPMPQASHVTAVVCVDCDGPSAMTSNGRCTRCGSSAVFEPGAKRFAPATESAIERRARYHAIVAAAMTRVARATLAAARERERLDGGPRLRGIR